MPGPHGSGFTPGGEASKDIGDSRADTDEPRTPVHSEQSVRARSETQVDPEVKALQEQHDKLKEETKSLRDQLTTLRIAALADVVDDIVVDLHGAQMMAMKRVFLTNKQALQFDTEIVAELLRKMDIPSPPAMVIFISPVSFTRSWRGKRMYKSSTPLKAALENSLDAATENESIVNERQVNRFVDDVLMPIIEDNNALVVCSRAVDGCSFCNALGRAFEALRTKRGHGSGGPRLLAVVETPLLAGNLVSELLEHELNEDKKSANDMDDDGQTEGGGGSGERAEIQFRSNVARVLWPASTRPALSAAGEQSLRRAAPEAGSGVASNSFVSLSWLKTHLEATSWLTNFGKAFQFNRPDDTPDKRLLRDPQTYTHRFDLMRGATDVIFLDCLDATTNEHAAATRTSRQSEPSGSRALRGAGTRPRG